MKNFEKIIDQIKLLKHDRKTVLVAIDGFGGSGKSSLTRLIKDYFPDSIIIEMDDFYSPQLKRADFQRVLIQVVKPLRDNKIAIYQIYDWKNDKLIDSNPIHPGNIVIIEGVFSSTQELSDYYDVKVWVDCPPLIGLERGVLRDGEEVRDKWQNVWMPLEIDYVKTQNPKDKADYIINGTKLPKGAIRVESKEQ